jgi:dihydrodiol dehydrogenase / D-xylose 1-dehydrogenase (NADP)
MSSTPSPLRWGFLGCGRNSSDFATAVQSLDSITFQACAARSMTNAQDFAAHFGVARAYGSYEALCSDPEVDVVYVGTLHPSHFEHTTLALSRGKHVLVEKPMAMDAEQAAQAIALAREKKLFLMEGLWTKFFPAVRHVRQLLADGEIGDVHHAHAGKGFAFAKDNERLWKKELGGGGLLDTGVYLLAMATMVLGLEPAKVTAVGKLNEDGVDVFNSMTLEYAGNRFATLEYSMLVEMAETVTITGSKGTISIHPPFHTATDVTVVKYLENGEQKETTPQFPLPAVAPGASFNYRRSEGFLYEAKAVVQAIQHKQRECVEHPLEESLAVMKLMDRVRSELGLTYP